MTSSDACCEVQIVEGQGDVDGTYMLNARLVVPFVNSFITIILSAQSNGRVGGSLSGLVCLHEDRR